MVYDGNRGAIWFTDARTNSIGNLDIKSGIIKLYGIPAPNSGPMGIVLSPDRSGVWFTEITGNKLGNIDIESFSNGENISSNSIIKEYPVFEQPGGQSSGPTLLTFDNNGVLWATSSSPSTKEVIGIRSREVIMPTISFSLMTTTKFWNQKL